MGTGFFLEEGSVFFADTPALSGVDDSLALQAARHGAFLASNAQHAASSHTFVLGKSPLITRFVTAYRSQPGWMQPQCGFEERDILPETQFYLGELPGEQYLLILPLVDGNFRACLQGSEDGISVICETGDAATAGRFFRCIYLAVGSNPYTLIRRAMEEVTRTLKKGRLRSQKALPSVLDYFGWSTQGCDSVTKGSVAAVLRSFADSGVRPRFMILEDGWQMLTEDGELASFAAGEGIIDLEKLTDEWRVDFGLRFIYAWHAMQGSRKGVSSDAMPEYHAERAALNYSETVLHHCPELAESKPLKLVPPDHIDRFFNDYHRYLMEQGVDGVKVDNQASLEAMADGHGGRVDLMRIYREALEGSVQCHFLGELINSMSCSNDMLFQTFCSNLTRVSCYDADDSSSHGMQLYASALNSFFVSELVHPDWDVFESTGDAAALHAAARAVSGGPVCVIDRAGNHNTELLNKLVCSDGTVLRSQRPGRITRDTLFTNPVREDAVLKVFNRNAYGGVVAAFNCQYHEDESRRHFLSGSISPIDIEGLRAQDFALYSHRGKKLVRCKQESCISIWLAERGYEVVTVMPIQNGFAPMGLVDKFNSGAAVRSFEIIDSHCRVVLRDGGMFLAYCANEPVEVRVNGQTSTFNYDSRSSALRLQLENHGAVALEFLLG